MNFPGYIKIGISYMRLSKNSQEYTTYGWELPTRCIHNVDGELRIKDFMAHLDGKVVTPISKEEYTAEYL